MAEPATQEAQQAPERKPVNVTVHLDEALWIRARHQSIEEGRRSVSRLLEDALRQYLDANEPAAG